MQLKPVKTTNIIQMISGWRPLIVLVSINYDLSESRITPSSHLASSYSDFVIDWARGLWVHSHHILYEHHVWCGWPHSMHLFSLGHRPVPYVGLVQKIWSPYLPWFILIFNATPNRQIPFSVTLHSLDLQHVPSCLVLCFLVEWGFPAIRVMRLSTHL